MSAAKAAMVSARSSSSRRCDSTASRLFCGLFKPFLAIPEFLDALRRIGRVEVGRFEGMPNSTEPALYILKFRFDGLQLRSLFTRHAVHLLVEDPNEAVDIALGENVFADVEDDGLFK